MRICIGCKQKGEKAQMLRFALHPFSQALLFDFGKRFPGRGASLHVAPGCLSRAVRSKAFDKALKRKVSIDQAELTDMVFATLDERVRTLLGIASAKRQLAIGFDSCCQAIRAGNANLVISATDSKRQSDIRAEVRRSVAPCQVWAWKDKQALGNVVGRNEVGLIAVMTQPAFTTEINRIFSHIAKLAEER